MEIDKVIDLKDKGDITLNELREWVRNNIGIELTDDKQILADEKKNNKMANSLQKINKKDLREIQLEAGQWVQTVMNKIENKKWSDYDINEKYYLNAIEKEINNIIGVKSDQLMLFE